MFKVLTSGETLQEALASAQAHAVDSLTVDGELLPFRQVNVDLSTSAPLEGESFRFAGSVTFQVEFPEFVVQVDQDGAVTRVVLPGVDVSGFTVAGVALGAKREVN